MKDTEKLLQELLESKGKVDTKFIRINNMTKRIKICEGNTYHEVQAYVEDEEFKNDHTHMIYKKGVWLFNVGDQEYYQVFQSPEELDEFIEKLNKARKEVFGA